MDSSTAASSSTASSTASSATSSTTASTASSATSSTTASTASSATSSATSSTASSATSSATSSTVSCSATGISSGRMTGISPVSSATVTAWLLPRRRRRRPPAGGAPMVPLRASNSATEIGRALSSDGLIVSRLSIARNPADPQHPARRLPPKRFHRLRCRVDAE